MGKLGRAVKDYMRSEFSGAISKQPNVVVTSFSSVSVTDMQKLRIDLKASSSKYMVVKNSIARLALKDAGLEGLVPMVDGSIGLSMSADDVISAFKVLVKFSKDHENFKIKGAVLDGLVLDKPSVERIAQLPSREALIAQLLGTMKSPINNFVYVLKGSLNKLVYCINAISKKKEGEVKNG